jgi:hypothetical protein
VDQVGQGNEVGQGSRLGLVDQRGKKVERQDGTTPSVATTGREEKKRADAEARKRQRAQQAQRDQIDHLEARIAECEAAIRELEQLMAAPGFYDDRAAAKPIVDRHQALMWQVGDLMHQWEELQSATDLAAEA